MTNPPGNRPTDLNIDTARSRASAGQSLGGRPPYGYRREHGKLVPDPETAPIRSLIYELFIEHKRQRTVARILNERGYRTAAGRQFTRQTVVRILRDTTAKGLLRTNYSCLTESGPALKPKDEWVWQEVPAIVSPKLWNEANAILDAERADRSHIGRPANHLFSGYVRCACGGAMYVPTRAPHYRCRKCANTIPVADLEAIYIEELDQPLRHQWPRLSARERRDIVALLTNAIAVGPDTVTIELRSAVDAPKNAMPVTSP